MTEPLAKFASRLYNHRIMANKFWGDIFELGTCLAMLPVAVANGVRTLVTEGDFEEGASIIGPAMEAAAKYGNDHNDEIGKVAVTLTAAVMGGVANGATRAHMSNKQLPPKSN